MLMTKPLTIKDTDKSKNLQVKVDQNLTLDEMEQVMNDVGGDLKLVISHITTLSKKKNPGNRHWHFKEDINAKGCLDVTYWPNGSLLWITIRNYEPNWVHKAGREMARLLTERMAPIV